MSPQLSDALRNCADHCTRCHVVCIETIAHGLTLSSCHRESPLIRAMLDCATICETCASLISRRSPFHQAACAVCAEACLVCADECERMGTGDPRMRRCAEICRACATACQEACLLVAV
jgi:hypothetical protein